MSIISANYKGLPITVFSSIAATATSNIIDLSGFNSAKVYVEVTGTGVWRLDFQGSATNDGTFIDGGLGTSHYFSASRSVTIPCTSDYLKIVATEMSDGATITVRIQGLTDTAIDNPIPKYQDLGAVVDTTNMAASAVVYSSWYDNVQWVRNIVGFVKSDQQFDIGIQRRDTALDVDWTGWIISAGAATGSAFRQFLLTQATSTGTTVIGAQLGYSSRFAVKNSSASSNTYAKLKIQLQGQ